MRPNKSKSQSRRGIAVVELAVCLPVLVVVLLGSIEICNAIFLKQAATAAAYEGVKVATGSGGTKQVGESRANEILQARGLEGTGVVFEPADPLLWTRGTPIELTVSIPASNNLGGVELFYQGQTLTASVIMVKQ